MRVIVIGSGSMWNEHNSASYMIDDDILVDVPNGTCKNLFRMDINPRVVENILLTHFHGNHYFDIPFYLLIKTKAENKTANVYCSKDDDIESSLYYKGLGLTNIRIEPHFDINDSDRINNVLIPDSNKKSFVALPNESFIVINKGGVSLFGDAYYFNEGKYNKIENNINEIISLMKWFFDFKKCIKKRDVISPL